MKYFALIASVVLAGACSDSGPLNSPNDTTNKIEVTGYLDASKVKTTTSSPLNSSSEVLVTIIGIQDAATPLRELTAINERSGTSNNTIVAQDGSFVVAVPALLGDTINLTVDGAAETPLDVETWDDQPQFPAISEDGILVERSAESPDYIFISIQLITPLESGFLEVMNITNDHYAILEYDSEPHDEPGEEESEPESEPENDPELPHDDNFYSSQLMAEPGDILFIVHNNEGIISEAIEIIAPDSF